MGSSIIHGGKRGHASRSPIWQSWTSLQMASAHVLALPAYDATKSYLLQRRLIYKIGDLVDIRKI